MTRPTFPHRSIAMVLATVLVPLAVAASASSAASQPPTSTGPEGLTVKLLSRGTLEAPVEVETKGIELETERSVDVAVARVTIEPGGTSGWHIHPGPTVVTVTAGELTHTHNADCEQETFTAGQTYIEEGPHDLGTVHNTGDTDLVAVVTFFVPTGAELLLPRPAPRCSH